MSKILQAIQKYADEKPDQTAFWGENYTGKEQTLTYTELYDRIHLAAKILREQGSRCIALKAENCLEWVITDLAAMLAGIAIVPIPTFFSEEQVQHVLKESGADVLVGEWYGYGEAVTYLDGLPVYERVTNGSSRLLPGTGKITFTSGSTGTPKGVCLSISNLECITDTLASKLRGQSHRHLIFLPLSTLLENITGIYVPLLLGVTSVIFRGNHLGLTGSCQFDPILFAKAVEKLRPDSLVLTPALLMALIQIVQTKSDLAKSLTFVAVGGARVSPELITVAHQLGIPAYQGYGLSECTSVVSLNTPVAGKAGSCGKILPHAEVRVSADDELLVKGNTALGYLGEPFCGDWYATGDIGWIDKEGFLFLKGRKKNQIITGFGRNISPEWIESQAQIYVPDCTLIVTGEAQNTLSAVVNTQVDIMENIRKLNTTLPDYACIHRLLVVPELHSITHWFTANGRPIRPVIESWVNQTLSATSDFPYLPSGDQDIDYQLIRVQPSAAAVA
ncbi:long-chain fatty acid--CoA ligase [Vibrio sp. HA2012]|uniref:AMP-binding protein n=1 Tax=Vibrio sp. HA2012 TaxID=1971595 RepID=UPI000C2B94F2|nr:AMP-binding protein [Vibrio sp. HA2012]PJC86029.1 long-chain fatty acid--CoA ligase [Vibrio sp. HA2012]